MKNFKMKICQTTIFISLFYLQFYHSIYDYYYFLFCVWKVNYRTSNFAIKFLGNVNWKLNLSLDFLKRIFKLEGDICTYAEAQLPALAWGFLKAGKTIKNNIQLFPDLFSILLSYKFQTKQKARIITKSNEK
jgi:hypothetical protein